MSVSVVAGTLTTQVTAGKAIMDGHLYENTASLTLTHSLPEATLDRIDRVVLRLDLRNAERNIKLRVKEGVASASPVAPTLQRDNVIYEISLARVLVRKNTVQLLAGDLTDERLDETLAGLVHSLISIPTSQFQAEWDAFMADIQGSGFATVASVTTVSNALTTHKADYLKHTGYAVATGSANTYVATLNPALSAYIEGVSLRLKVNVANTGASTVNVNGLGAKAILKSNGSAVSSGNLKLGSVYTLAYDGTSFILQGEGGEYGTAIAGDVLTGKTIGTDAGVIVGTMPNRGAFNLGLGVSVPAGYYSEGITANGKKFATGTKAKDASLATFTTGAGATAQFINSLTVTGLSFTPSIVYLCDTSTGESVTVLNANSLSVAKIDVIDNRLQSTSNISTYRLTSACLI
jgi:hypothetical protein